MTDHLSRLESKSVHILREAYAAFGNLCMLWSIGKDSTVLLWLARKAFYGHVPFPLVHIDTHHKIPEMIEYRDRLAMEYGLYMVYGENREALDRGETFPDGKTTRVECCRLLKTEALTHTLDGTWPRYRLNLKTGKYEIKQRLFQDGYRWFNWNAGDNDKWQKGNTENLPDEEYFMKSYRECMRWFDNEPETPVVFLFHDTEEGTVKILPAVMHDLVERGYRFKTLDTHPDWDALDMSALTAP